MSSLVKNNPAALTHHTAFTFEVVLQAVEMYAVAAQIVHAVHLIADAR